MRHKYRVLIRGGSVRNYRQSSHSGLSYEACAKSKLNFLFEINIRKNFYLKKERSEMSEKITRISDSNFDSMIITTSAKPNLIFFSAGWNGQSRMIRPVLEDAVEKFKSRMTFYELDTDDNPATMMKYYVTSVPTLIIFKNGQIIDRVIGLANRDKLNKIIEKAIETSDLYKNMVAFSKKLVARYGAGFGV
jgi:thioredoxin 1